MKKRNAVLGMLIVIALSLDGCSWSVNLVVANLTANILTVQYKIQSNDSSPQFLREPKTYLFTDRLKNLSKTKVMRPVSVSTQMISNSDSSVIVATIGPGQALHIGRYHSFQPRIEILSKYKLEVKLAKDSTINAEEADSNFRHWKNMYTDLLEVK